MASISYIDLPHIDNLAKEIMSNMKEVELANGKKELDLSLFDRKKLSFRDIVNTVFPTILIVDYSDIKNELTKFVDLDAAVKQDISPTSSAPAKATKLSSKQVTNIVNAVRSGIKAAVGQAPTITESEFLAILTEVSNQDSPVSKMKARLPGIYKILSAGTKEFFLFPNFESVQGRINNRIALAIEAEAALGSDVGTVSTVGNILAYGHTAINAGEEYLINTPKIMSLVIESINSASSAKNIFTKASIDTFVKSTRQLDVHVDVTKDFSSSGALSMFVKIGGNVVRFENTAVNSLRGSTLEKTGNIGTDKQSLAALSTSMRNLQNMFADRIARKLNTLVIGRGSPSILDFAYDLVAKTLKGNKLDAFKGTDKISASLLRETVSKTTEQLNSIKSSNPKLSAIKLRTIQGQFYSLPSLMTLINEQLSIRIRDNMGKGDSRTLLNYRSGRLAESAKVERMSVSRDGMITAFYSYMNNPYGTFSVGGLQSMPASRDPKTLISKSIREIAASKVANRMRAVLV